MYYLIDFDERYVKYKSENRTDLERYVEENGLSMAMTIISSEDELCLEFSLDELTELSKSFKRNRTYTNEEEAAKDCWNLMNNLYPHMIAPLSYNSFNWQAGVIQGPTIFDLEPEGIPTSPSILSIGEGDTGINFKKRKRRRKLPDSTVLSLGKKPKESTVLFEIWKIVDDNFGSCTIDEVVFESLMDEEKCRRTIARCIADGHLIIEK